MDKIIFVYNADSGLFNSITDAAHKTLRPGTYACNLCRLTYGNLTMKKKWKEFIESLDLEAEFLHKDEFKNQFSDKDIQLPAVLSEEGEVLITAPEINDQDSLEDLMSLMCRQLEV